MATDHTAETTTGPSPRLRRATRFAVVFLVSALPLPLLMQLYQSTDQLWVLGLTALLSGVAVVTLLALVYTAAEPDLKAIYRML